MPRIIVVIMVGYYEELKAYKLFDLVKLRIIKRRGAIFDKKISCITLMNPYSKFLSSDPIDIL